jgi:hypothetical protein
MPVLGGLKAAWLAARGNPTKGVVGDLFPPGIEVNWAQDAAGAERAQHIELLLRTAVAVGQAKDQAKVLHPPDGRLTRTYVARAGQTVEVFQSALLAEAFAGQPGLPSAACPDHQCSVMSLLEPTSRSLSAEVPRPIASLSQ